MALAGTGRWMRSLGSRLRDVVYLSASQQSCSGLPRSWIPCRAHTAYAPGAPRCALGGDRPADSATIPPAAPGSGSPSAPTVDPPAAPGTDLPVGPAVKPPASPPPPGDGPYAPSGPHIRPVPGISPRPLHKPIHPTPDP